MEFSHIQTAQIAAVAASALGKDKDEKKTGDETEKRRAHHQLLAQMRRARDVSQVESTKDSFLA